MTKKKKKENLAPLKIPKSILAEAAEIRGGNRAADYGDAVECFKLIAEIATLLIGVKITPEECCIVQMALKLARERYKHKRDNLVDLCGYADILYLIRESEDEETKQ